MFSLLKKVNEVRQVLLSLRLILVNQFLRKSQLIGYHIGNNQSVQDAGVIQESCSQRDGSLQFCIDYRNLNLLPRIDDLLDRLGKARYFTTLDLAAGHRQIKVKPNNQEKTAFIMHQGLYEFKVMPLG